MALGLPVVNQFIPESNLSEVMRLIISNGIILYALAQAREVTAVNKKISDFLFKNKVVILFLLLCVGATAASKQPLTFVIPELFTRIARNAFIVLALIIPVITGLGLNFGIVVGAMAAQIALFLTTYWGFTGVGGFFITVALATLLRWCSGISW